jgi:uncharacterized membrane protein YeaQ/YmgE (transglycosylase-associated protein family)
VRWRTDRREHSNYASLLRLRDLSDGPPRRQHFCTLEIAMSIGIWIMVGLVAGFVASKLVIRSGEGTLRDVGLGIGGAIAGGWLFTLLTTREAAGLDVFGLVVTLASAGAVLVVYHTFFPHVRKA